MLKPPFMDVFDSKLRPEERIFKFKSGELFKDVFTLTLLLDHRAYDGLLNDELKSKVLRITKEILPPSFKTVVRYVKADSEDNTVIKHLMEYVYKERPTIYTGIVDSQIAVEHQPDLVLLKITLEKYLYEYVTNSTMKEEIIKYLENRVMEDVDVEFFSIPNKDEVLINKRRNASGYISISTIDIEILEFYLGNITTSPRYIGDVYKREFDDVVLCGKISNVRPRYIERIDKDIYTFILNDTSGNIKVKFFAKPYPKVLTAADEAILQREKELAAQGKKVKKTVDWSKIFVDGNTLVMEGPIKFDEYDKANVFMPKKVAKCTIDYSSINLKKDFLPEPDSYLHVFPKPMEAPVQDNIFVSTKNPDLDKNVFVVFDLETTGLEATADKIIEIAAIKLVNGEISESFDCFVNPGIGIPQEIVELTHITDEMVARAYRIEDVIGDFYKFTRNTIMVAHNASFDMSFISVAGKRNLYDFDNAFIDTLALSRQLLTTIRHHNLETVCKHLKISLNGAHRAINDALATAKVFIELMNRKAR